MVQAAQTKMNFKEELISTAKKICAPGKGILAADESTGTIGKRFDAIKSQWLEILRISKKGQSMRIYKSLQELIDFCLAAGFLN